MIAMGSSSAQGWTTRKLRQIGFSLVELMIAIALGVILILGLIEVFSGVRLAFAASEGLSRLQENARFAMEFLRVDSRMAGHVGCRSEYQVIEFPGVAGRGFYNHTNTVNSVPPAADRPLSDLDSAPYALQLHRPVQVYDYVATGGTSPGSTFTPTLAAFPGGIGAAAAFVPPLPAALTTTGLGLGTTGLVGGQVGDPVPGSDILMLRYLSEASVVLPNGMVDGTLRGANSADFPQWRVFGVTDCQTASLFQITTNGSPVQALASGATNLNRRAWGYNVYGNFVPVYAYEVALYYVGRTGAATPPALFRRRVMQAPAVANEGAFFGEPEELVSGVEMMQVLIGVDTEVEGAAPTPPLDDTVNAFRSASEHLPNTLTVQQRFDRERSIKTLRVSLLVRSPEIGAATDPVSPTRLVGDVLVTPPLDRRLRHVYDSTISIRNRIRN